MHVSTLGLGLSLLLLFACSTRPRLTDSSEPTAGTAGAPAMPAAPRVTEEDGSCQPEILSDPNTHGDIPDFVAKLAQAYCSADPAVCAQLPTPAPQIFDEGDYQIRAPSRAEWLGYCQALVNADPQACETIDYPAEPNLRFDCEGFFQTLAARDNDSPAFCLAQMGVTFNSADEVGNCLAQWVLPIYGLITAEQCMAQTAVPPLTSLDLALFCCMRLPRPSQLTVGQPDQQQCLFDLAQSSQNDRVCLLIADPYASNPQSLPSCLKALGK